jgi:hypothetical protein
MQNFSRSWKSIEEQDTILQESLSKDENEMFTGKTERKPTTLFSNPLTFLFAVPAMLSQDTLNPNLPLFREIPRTKEPTWF